MRLIGSRTSFTCAIAAAAAVLGVAVLGAGTASAASADNMSVNGSANQVWVTGANPGEKLRLLDRKKKRVAVEGVSSLGGVVFRRVPAGKGYRVRATDGSLSAPIAVMSSKPKPPNPSVYNQTLPAGGYGYLTTRDGTKLAISVRLPGPVEDGPYPTVVEYAGYGYANPAGPESGIADIANVLDYAVVDVNMRGTGCSGGAYDYFERLQALDGYDIIETVAKQPWVLNDKVGMMGVSFGGISQLFVASTNPPSLAGITPLSVIDNTATTLYPGGILNTGFALEWAEDRADDARPATATTGQGWAYNRIQNGDFQCKANQVLHASATDLISKVHRNRFYRPKVADPLNPSGFVHKIKVPVFLACQFNDEQTGGHCPNLINKFTGTNKKWFTFTNGLHIDSLDPPTFNRWFDFLELYIAQRRPVLSPLAKATASVVYSQAMGVNGVTLPPDPVQSQPTYETALAEFEKAKEVRILFDNGAGGNAQAPVPGFERSYHKFPVPNTQARSFYLGPNGGLQNKAPKKGGSQTFVWDKESRPADNFVGTNTGGGDLWTDHPSYDWRQPPDGKAATFISPPLAADEGMFGQGALQTWIRASVPDVDLQVTVSEVRPDGKETYVQSGYLRTSLRKLDGRRSTLLEPRLSLRKSEASKLPKGKFEKIVVPLYYQGHVYRAGSRIRITVAPPAGDQPVWAFAESVPQGDANVTLAFGNKRPSRLILPKIPGLSAPTPLPACPALRGEPCRTYTGP